MQNGHKAISATLTHTVTDKLIYTLQRRHMATAGHAPTKSVRPREDERGRGGVGGNEAKAAQIISHHLSVKIRILNKRATRNYHGPGIKAAPTDRETKRPRRDQEIEAAQRDLARPASLLASGRVEQAEIAVDRNL